MPKRTIFSALAALCLAGCVSTTINTPNPTATEQMLPSLAAETAAESLVRNLALPAGARVALETSPPGSPPAGQSASSTSGMTANDRYVVQAVRDHLRQHDLIVVEAPDADIIVSLRISADSIDDLTRVLGLPAMTVPSFQTGVPAITMPELSILSEHQREGIVQLYATAVRRTGQHVASVGPVFAGSKITNRHILTGFVFGQELQRPGVRAETLQPAHP